MGTGAAYVFEGPTDPVDRRIFFAAAGSHLPDPNAEGPSTAWARRWSTSIDLVKEAMPKFAERPVDLSAEPVRFAAEAVLTAAEAQGAGPEDALVLARDLVARLVAIESGAPHGE